MNRFSRDANMATASSHPFGASRATSAEQSLDGADVTAGSSEEARRLLDEVQQLGTRMRLNRRKAQLIDRRAAAYASRLARHTAQLLQRMPNAMPAVRPIPGTGASTLRHYVLKHDQLEAPDRTRLLVLSSDGELRVCTVLTDGQGTRLWADYDVVNPPPGLGLSVVFEALSSMIVHLESAVHEAEAISDSSASALDGMIAESEAKLANAGSRLTSVEPAPDDHTDRDQHDDVFGHEPKAGLRSWGFEERLPSPPSKAATALNKPGRFAR